MKTLNTVLCGLSLLLATTLHAQDDWTLQNPATKPSARQFHAMASLGGDQVLLFGGQDAGFSSNNETWVYDLSDNTWTLKSPATQPSARYGHALASLGGDQVLLFGGYDAGGKDDETWVYDLSDNTWTLKSPATKPTERIYPAMASLGGDRVLLFGGRFFPGINSDETWVYDLSDNTWALQSPSTKPSARYSAMASLGGGQVLLFGGNDGSSDDETWVYTASPEVEVKPFVFLANKVTLKSTKQSTPAGDIHSNGTLVVEKGKPSTYNSNLTAIGKITINKQNTINGNVKSQTSVSNSGTITGTTTIGTVANEPLPSLSYSAGGSNKTVPLGGSLTLAPGSYGIVTMSNGGTLKLSSGEYFMNELRYASTIEAGTIEIDLSSGDPVTINVVSNLQLGHEAAIVLLPNGESDSKLVTFNTLQSTNANWGREGYFLGSFNAPNAIVTLVKNSQLRGSICAKEIVVSNDCLFLHHDSPGSLPGPGNLPKASGDDEEVDSDQSPVTSYQLKQNYPNPFNPSTTISFALPQASEVTLSIFNTSGQLVKQVANGKFASGRHSFVWEATNENGERVASGVYLYVIKAGEFTAQRKLLLMK